ncbi:gas vesicle protein [Rhodococcus sp. 14C212]|uniref:gas vesicle protein GvpO n=1 Tax=Rhodococcus sp. 14C212 TaxID=2711209 RepID=UPI0013EBCDC4|nr:gas vesicle protein GvpO [Rhodococcus sp. 14C212]NGP08352.1 gas vesicle protein [Rhodococcus sp. 14C212]
MNEQKTPKLPEHSRTGGRQTTAALSAAGAAVIAVRCIAQLTGKPCEGAISVVPSDDGWVVEVEVVDDRRIPSSADILAIFEVDLGREGVMRSYRRTRRYGRGSREPQIGGAVGADDDPSP